MTKTVNFEYTVKRTRRKTFGVYVFRHGGVEVRVPHRARQFEVTEFVESCAQWVNEKLSTMPFEPQIEKPNAFEHGSIHYFMGDAITIDLVTGFGKTVLQEKVLRIYTEDSCSNETVEKKLIAWFRQQTKKQYPEAVRCCLMAMSEYGLKEPPLAIRRMRTRWGSCSSRGNINLNLWLIRLPQHLQDYVITHELCHLKELNHSPRFHALMDNVMPDWRCRKRELEDHPGSCLAAVETR